MKTNLNYKDCSFILNRSEEYCQYLLMKEQGKIGIEKTLTKKEFKEESASWRISVDRLSEITDINVAALIKDMNDNFFKNEICVEYLLKKVGQKYKPNAKTGAFPLTIAIPEEITALMSDENQNRCIEICEERISPNVTFKINKETIL
jgi:hypothetical protein